MFLQKIGVRYLLILICIFSLLSSTAIIPVASSQEIASISFGTPYVKAGQNAAVSVKISHNPGIATFRFRVAYNKDVLTPISVVHGELLTEGELDSMVFDEKGELSFLWYSVDHDLTEDGEIAIINFSTSNSAAGINPISVVFDPEDIVNTKKEKIPCTVSGGHIEIGAPASGVSINKDLLTLKEDESTKLVATVVPSNSFDKSVSWSSDNTDVAGITADGTVIAKKAGVANITATSTDGGFKAQCTVTVLCSHKHVTEYPAESSTCCSHGHAAYNYCEDCKQVILGNGDPLPLANHSMIYHPAAEPTNKTDGNIEYWFCDVCKEYFVDSEGHNRVSADDIILKAIRYVYGDVDQDGKINAADALLILKAAVNKISLDAEQLLIADVNGDGYQNATDALLVLKRSVMKIKHFPVEEK